MLCVYPSFARLYRGAVTFILSGFLGPYTFQWSYTLVMVVELTFDFDVQLLCSIFQ